ncbi:class I SAM-dependent methyltransferase [Leptospira sp. 'Mane']|uniref:class I SAM-dependent methyltransferase n=1 Tax=Leptospira sp. 'Mane' TaxID=3387407 RepID=UPI00398BB18C
MNGNHIKGTEGYSKVIKSFIENTLAIDFIQLHQDFLPFFPKKISRILDIGAGIGRDAYEFSKMGHSVTAVEPIQEFRVEGKILFDHQNIKWIDDCLPDLKLLGFESHQFDFILVSGVWHHLDMEEQYRSIIRIAQLLDDNGIFSVTLRNGPAGAGTHVFPTNGNEVVEITKQYGLKTLLFLENQTSLMKNKENVSWTKLVFQK